MIQMQLIKISDLWPLVSSVQVIILDWTFYNFHNFLLIEKLIKINEHGTKKSELQLRPKAGALWANVTSQ